MSYISKCAIVLFACGALSVVAQAPTNPQSAFRYVKNMPEPAILVPTVLELPLEVVPAERNTYAVYHPSRDEFLPYEVFESYTESPVPLVAYSGSDMDEALVDGYSHTSVDYPLRAEGVSQTSITLTGFKPIESSALVIDLDQYVALPTSISVRAIVGGVEQIIVAPTRMSDTVVRFPRTVAQEWVVTLEYGQPLRINEIRLVQDSAERTLKRSLRFLAQPESGGYVIYHDPDRSVEITTVERGNLRDDRDVQLVRPISSVPNGAYKRADTDGDSVPDQLDNCVMHVNTDQKDLDRNGRGDVCDDFDRDGVLEGGDNCPGTTNKSQVDTDRDGVGDACDTEESRFTEKYPWVPWVGMGTAGLVILVLFVLVATTPPKNGVQSGPESQ